MQGPALNSSTPLKDERHFWQFNHPGKPGGRLRSVCGGSRARGNFVFASTLRPALQLDGPARAGRTAFA